MNAHLELTGVWITSSPYELPSSVICDPVVVVVVVVVLFRDSNS